MLERSRMIAPRFLAFLFFLLVATADARHTNGEDTNQDGIHHHMTKREIEKYFGVGSHHDDYDVVVPVQADEAGNFLSFKLHEHARLRRDVGEPAVWYYSVNAFGAKLQLNLTKNQDLFPPGFFTEIVHKNGSRTVSGPPTNTFYNGHVMSDPSSSVAISNDGGLRGMIRYLDDTFFMHPLPTHLAAHSDAPGGAQPHILYRRPLNGAQSWCGVKDAEFRFRRSAEQQNAAVSGDKRSAGQKYMETAMVADDLLLERYSEEEAKDHLIMLAHMTNSIFHDSSIGHIKMTIALVSITILPDGLGYDKSSTREERIGNLAKWAGDNIPPNDDDPKHADGVVLVTRYLGGGLALKKSLCYSKIARSVSGDIGLQTSLIIAHEVGHTMGADHDAGPKGTECANDAYIMSTSVPGGRTAKKWSTCTSAVLQEFLGGSASSCLDDSPDLDTSAPAGAYQLPGQTVGADEQCEMQYGEGYKQCEQLKSTCSSLYCTKDGSECFSTVAPAADGTVCGERQWCINGECVDDGSPLIDGGWSEWSEYGECSTPCDGGVQYRSRTCTNPPPGNGGSDCEGLDKGHWRICNAKACDPGTTTFRSQQCSDIEAGMKPYYTKKDQCTLRCQKKGYYSSYGVAKAGTRCSADRLVKDVCIENVCRSVGCDGVLESGAEPDRCGVCNGDSSECKVVTGEYDEDCKGIGPSKPCLIVELPVGSTELFVEKLEANFDGLGVKTTDGKYVYSVPSWSITKAAAGTKIVYTKKAKNYKDTLYIQGPTTEPLQILYVDFTNQNKPVQYRYFTAESGAEVSAEDVFWETSEWGACSEDCAGGFQKRTVKCLRKDDSSFVNREVCLKDSPMPPEIQPCNIEPCAPEWYTSRWLPCSKTCGTGEQTREIYCRKKISSEEHESLLDSSCPGEKPGPRRRECNAVACPPGWFPSDWGKCSEACGGGLRHRNLSCQQQDEQGTLFPVAAMACAHAPKLETEELCNEDVLCSEIPIGCFQVRSDSPLEVLENLKGQSPDVMKSACAQLAHDKHYHYFAVGDNGKCYSGPNAGRDVFSEDSASNIKKCPHNVGARRAMFVFSFYPPPKVEPLGCFNEQRGDRALPEQYATFRGQVDWSDMQQTVNQCAYVARSRGYTYFGIQNYADCWAGRNVAETYAKYGKAKGKYSCWSGVGAPGKNFVYKLV